MNEDKYIGMDVHQASIICAAHNREGKYIAHSIPCVKASGKI